MNDTIGPYPIIPKAQAASVQIAKAQGAKDDMTYEPKNILITGGAGFIASHVAEHLFFKYPKYKLLSCRSTSMRCKSYQVIMLIEGFDLGLQWSS